MASKNPAKTEALAGSNSHGTRESGDPVSPSPIALALQTANRSGLEQRFGTRNVQPLLPRPTNTEGLKQASGIELTCVQAVH